MPKMMLLMELDIMYGPIDSILFESYKRYLNDENFKDCFPDGLGLFSINISVSIVF